MHKHNRLFFFGFFLSIFSGCSMSDTSYATTVCENYFQLTNDFNHRYPDQGDYMSFLKGGYYQTFFEYRDGFNCHYHLEYQSGDVVDDWGTYVISGTHLIMHYPNAGDHTAVFTCYHSPTIDFHIIETISYDGDEYKIVYQARDWATARG